MASRRISNIEVAGIATVALGVAGVLTSSCYPLGERGATQDEQIAGDSKGRASATPPRAPGAPPCVD